MRCSLLCLKNYGHVFSKWIFPNKKNATTQKVPSVLPSFGSPIFKWEKGLSRQDSKTQPDNGWSIKKYNKGDKNLLDGNIDAIEGSPMIVGFDTTETNEYKSYFTDFVTYRMNQNEDIDQAEKDQYSSEIISKLNVQSHIENVFLYGQSKSSVYKNMANAARRYLQSH